MAKTSQRKPYKATVETVRTILDAISEGLTQREASILAGISEDTLSLWKRKDSDFSEQIRQKEIEHKRSHIRNIKRASEKSWQASAWWLERKHKDEFSTKSNVDIKSTENIDKLTLIMQELLTSSKVRKV